MAQPASPPSTQLLSYTTGTWCGYPQYTCACGYNTLNLTKITAHSAVCLFPVETQTAAGTPAAPARVEGPPAEPPAPRATPAPRVPASPERIHDASRSA